MCYRIIFIFLFIICPDNLLLAQWTKSVSVSGSFDDNAFRNYAGVSDYVTDISGYLAGDVRRNRWRTRIFYRGSYNLFARFNKRNFHFHRLGVAYTSTVNDRGYSLNLGINGGLRSNRTLYNYYNLRETSAFGNIKIPASPSSALSIGYRLRGRWYINLSDLNYSEYYFFIRFSHYFKTRTTVILESNFGRKAYLNPLSLEGNDSATGQTYDDETIDRYGHHRGGRGHMNRNEFLQTDNPADIGTAVNQLIAQLRLAQSLAKTIGLSIEYTLRHNPGGVIRYLGGQISGYISEDDLFDDRYGYESNEFAAQLTQVLPGKFTVNAGADLRWKDYVERIAFDLDGEPLPDLPLREDRLLQFRLSLSKQFSVSGNRTVNLIAEGYWIDNYSNDLYYDYRVRQISLGVGISL